MNNDTQIYLDNASTTKVDKLVLAAMLPFFSEKYENPSSLHDAGSKVSEDIQHARKIIADSINANSSEIIFTSGGTESNNYVLKGVSQHFKKGHIITQQTEHPSIINTCKQLQKDGFKVTYLKVNKEGFINTSDLIKEITDETILVTIMHTNNEIGTIQPIKEIYQICKDHNILFHTDACQSYTKEDLDKTYADFITINAHKIHGPKGIGALYINQEKKIQQKIQKLLCGGSQEMNFRSGTENVPGIIGFAKAVEISKNEDSKKIQELRDYLIEQLLKNKNISLNGPKMRLANNVNVTIKNKSGDSLLLKLSKKSICISTGSACSSHEMKPSHVLKAIGLSDKDALSSIRISLSKYTTKKELEIFIEQLNIELKND